MTSQSSDDAARWLVEPLQPQDVRIFVAVGDEAELTPPLRAALEQLAAAMQQDEAVQGYACPNFECTHFICGEYTCGNFSAFRLFPTTGLSFGLFRP
jgi:hypothetical protein